jgi:hypothetical protein
MNSIRNIKDEGWLNRTTPECTAAVSGSNPDHGKMGEVIGGLPPGMHSNMGWRGN